MKEEKPRAVLFAAATIGAGLLLAGAFYLKHVNSQPKTEAQLVNQLLSTTEAPDEITVGERSFPDDLRDPYLQQAIEEVSRQIQGPIAACRGRWEGAPTEARVRMTTDNAGRLLTLAVEGAPENARSCLSTVLSDGMFPRLTDGIATLRLDF